MRIFLFIVIMQIAACHTYKDVRDIRLVGFEADAKKGRNVGEVEGKVCAYHAFGLWFGGAPTVGAAVKEARGFAVPVVAEKPVEKEEKAKADKTAKDAKEVKKEVESNELRYVNNLTVKVDGFDAIVFGKRCLIATGTGYK